MMSSILSDKTINECSIHNKVNFGCLRVYMRSVNTATVNESNSHSDTIPIPSHSQESTAISGDDALTLTNSLFNLRVKEVKDVIRVFIQNFSTLYLSRAVKRAVS